MGLTIHYEMKYKNKSGVKKLIENMRQTSLDLPFESVSEVIHLKGVDTDYEKQSDENLRWQLIQAMQSVTYEESSFSVCPDEMIAFEIYPGAGSEVLNVGLCLYPNKIECHGKEIKTKLNGWQWKSFCKTQYASNPTCGGIANFIKCHVAVITFLDKISKLQDVVLKMDDEGKYGCSNYSDDWQEARTSGKTPTYVDHEGKYSVKELIQEVGEWNEMIAGFTGGLNDLIQETGMSLKSPIAEFNNFEYLEFKGRENSDTLVAFLKVMDQVAKQSMNMECESQWKKV